MNGDGTLKAGTRLTVFSIRRTRGGAVWVRAGNAYVNKDCSVNLWLDVLPMDGRLHAREQVVEKRDAVMVPEATRERVAAELANAQMEGH